MNFTALKALIKEYEEMDSAMNLLRGSITEEDRTYLLEDLRSKLIMMKQLLQIELIEE